MTAMPRVRVGLSPVAAVLMLAAGAAELALYGSHGGTLPLLAGLAFVFGGITHLVGPLLVVDGGVVELKNPVGMTIRVLPFDRLEIVGRTLLVTSAGQTRRISGLLARRRDWRALAAAIAGGAA
jgi:hypothetical protein